MLRISAKFDDIDLALVHGFLLQKHGPEIHNAPARG